MLYFAEIWKLSKNTLKTEITWKDKLKYFSKLLITHMSLHYNTFCLINKFCLVAWKSVIGMKKQNITKVNVQCHPDQSSRLHSTGYTMLNQAQGSRILPVTLVQMTSYQLFLLCHLNFVGLHKLPIFFLSFHKGQMYGPSQPITSQIKLYLT